jgi:PTH1 family peptidyl-tRNA hydrolase
VRPLKRARPLKAKEQTRGRDWSRLVKVIFGLGNPGPKYAFTRHNIGFVILDRLVRSVAGMWQPDVDAESMVARLQQGASSVLLVKPQTYMNRSGLAVAPLRDRLGFEPHDMIVVLDDASLPCGRLRIRPGGGDGGHNGLASIIEEAGSQEIPRLRLGIGTPPAEADLTEYVLGEFSPEEDLNDTTEHACDAIQYLLINGIDSAMNAFNN